ncbi:protein kinase RIO1 [Sporobolomyces salmoneus]|uniref:protein kinase RIO1 n=1 Tax=Sporobolomyces salmoneus TaxID=183962 RepID=UPI00316CFCD8
MQFEDAPEEDYTAPQLPRHHSRIDDDSAASELPLETFHQPTAAATLTPSNPPVEPEGEEEYDSEEYYYSEDDEEEEEERYGLEDGLREVMDQDWADASGDFTKRYNRMKQQVVATRSPLAALPGSPATAASTSNSRQPSAAVLPALNRSRRQQPNSNLPQTAQNTAANSAGGAQQHHGNKVTDQLNQLQHRFANRLQLEPLHSQGTATRKGGSEKILVKDKSDRATNEQVLDPRTRLIIFKMLGRGLIERVDGCVSTGKEANVYHAVSPEGKHLALKIYKTSILVFKDRDRYVTGEFRFKNGYARSNPRKMVRLWAEKELRNLRRMRTAGLRVPEAIEVRENVLVMDFIQEDEWQASPRLKDASIRPSLMPSLYIEILQILRILFHRCRLVHADFSEYNILYHDSHLWIIDVSQSIEQEHPAAFDFLRADLKNAEEWFSRRGVLTLGVRKTFGFVTGDSWIKDREETDEDVKIEIERLLAQHEAELETQHEEQGDEEPSRLEETVGDIAQAQAKELQQASTNQNQKKNKTNHRTTTESDEAVFAQSYIPRALDDVYDAERDVQRVLRGEGGDLIYADITGVAKIHGQEGERHEDEDGSGSEDEGDSEDDDEEESGEEGEGEERRPRGKKHEDKEEKKKRRQEVKEKAREKRATKMSKAEKARRMKKSSGKR